MKWINHIDSTGYDLNLDLPNDAITDCSASGDVESSVRYWLKQLAFDAPVAGTKAYLEATGAWEGDQLADHDANLMRLLWIVACDAKENMA